MAGEMETGGKPANRCTEYIKAVLKRQHKVGFFFPIKPSHYDKYECCACIFGKPTVPSVLVAFVHQ